MGHSSLVFSSRLTSIARLLLRINVDSFDVYESKDNGFNTIVIECRIGLKKLSSSGISSELHTALLKALGELAEVLHCVDQPYDRMGIAAGFTYRTARDRALGELIERDAFLYHYRNQIPFGPLIYTDSEMSIFGLKPKLSGWVVCLAIDNETLQGSGKCIKLGLGCADEISEAIAKARGECEVMIRDHERRPDWCSEEPKFSSRLHLPDFHHRQSRDIRNQLRIRRLASEQTDIRRETVDVEPKFQKLKSPIRFFQLVRAQADLEMMRFGIPESGTAEEQPLYHPFW